MYIHPSGRDDPSFGIDLPACDAEPRANLDDDTVANANVAVEWRVSGTIDDETCADDCIEDDVNPSTEPRQVGATWWFGGCTRQLIRSAR